MRTRHLANLQLFKRSEMKGLRCVYFSILTLALLFHFQNDSCVFAFRGKPSLFSSSSATYPLPSVSLIARQGTRPLRATAKSKGKKAIDVDIDSLLESIKEEEEAEEENDDDDNALEEDEGEDNAFTASSSSSSSSSSSKTSLPQKQKSIQLTPMTSEYIDVDKITKALKRLGITSHQLEEIRQDCIPKVDKALKTYTRQKSSSIYSAASFFAITKVLGELIDLQITGYGGYRQAERKLIYFSKKVTDVHLEDNDHDDDNDHDYDKDNDDDIFDEKFMEITDDFLLCSLFGNFIFERYDHDEFVTKILEVCDLKESELGDVIVLGERGCQFFILPDARERVMKNLNNDTYFDSVPIKCEVIDRDLLQVREFKQKDLTTVEASLRVDSLASFGFGLSRSKVQKMVSKGDVSIDYKQIHNVAQICQVGQTITIRGKGNLVVKDCTPTNRGRLRVKMTKTS